MPEETHSGNVRYPAALLRRVVHSLKSHGTPEEIPSGVLLFCYDDVAQGIASGASTNGDIYLDSARPDCVIIHPPGGAFIPLQGLMHVKRMTGSEAVLYHSQAEQEKADAAQLAAQKQKRTR